jgi:hypothetical protein
VGQTENIRKCKSGRQCCEHYCICHTYRWMVFEFSSPHNAETILWQCVLFAISLVASAATVVFFFIWISNGLRRYPANTRMGVVVICLKLLIGICVLGIFGSGMISAVKWTIWPQIPVSFSLYGRGLFFSKPCIRAVSRRPLVGRITRGSTGYRLEFAA